jgi:diadenosine tetraphosphate (Ap4A) HIT family hydrolase
MAFTLHPKLMADAAHIVDWPLSRILLMNDKRFAWIVLVPRRPELSDLLDLEEGARAMLMAEIGRAGTKLKAFASNHGGCDKLNFGIIGNVVPQLHVHVVARKRGDAAWPGTVWGSGQSLPYEAAELEQRVAELRDLL